MANSSENEYDKKFQEDLEKATALSLETLALDQFKRTKLGYSTTEQVNAPKFNNQATNYITKSNLHRFLSQNNQYLATTTNNSIQTRSRPGSFNSGRQQENNISPLQLNVPRRHSHSHNNIPNSGNKEEDLISFAATSPTVPVKKTEENIQFDNLIQEIQRLNTEQSSSNQVNASQGFFQPTSYASSYGSAPSLAGAGSAQSGMQIVPYTPPATKARLTTEELTKLYEQPQHISYFQNSQYPPAASSIPIGPYVQQQHSYNFQLYSNQQLQQQNQQQKQQQQQYETNSERAMVQLPSHTKLNSIPKSASMSGVSSLASTSSSSVLNKSPNNSISLEVPRRNKKILGDNLIDLNHDDDNDSRVSVLEAFDPLLSDENIYDNDSSSYTTSYYAEYDPFDYLYSCGTQYSDPVYEAVNKSDRTPISPSASIGWKPEYIPAAESINYETQESTPPPLPPRNSKDNISSPALPPKDKHTTWNQFLDQKKFSQLYSTRLYEVITDRKTVEPELMNFYRMVKEVRANYRHDDNDTNVGHIVAKEFENKQCEQKSIKILVHPALDTLLENSERAQDGQVSGYGVPVAFTCDINTTVEFVIETVYYALEGQTNGLVTDFVCKTIGMQEWLRLSSKLSQLECVHDSIKLEKDVQLGFCRKTESVMKAIARTEKDDRDDAALKPEDILPNETATTITYDHMMILIETLENEIEKLESFALDASPNAFLTYSGVLQGVKAICALLGSIDTLELCEYVEDLKRICQSNSTTNSPNIVSEFGDYATVQLRPKTTLDSVKLKCSQIREQIQDLIETYSNAFRVNFCVKSLEYVMTPLYISDVLKPIIVRISCLHRTPPNWKYEDYSLGVQIYHGTRTFGETMTTYCSNDTSGGLFPRLKFDNWLSFDKSPICTLPRESRLVFVLYGTEPASENDQKNDDGQEIRKKDLVEIGWCALQIFDFSRQMICGNFLLSLWPPTKDRMLGPAPSKGSHPDPDFCPVLSIEMPSYGGTVLFNDEATPKPSPRYDFNSLDMNLQQELLDTAEQGYPGQLDKREVFWEKRHYLQDFPHALPKVLHAAHSWDYASLIDLHSLLKSWHPLTPLQALELLLPQYPDLQVRARAIHWISKMPNDQLVDYLPQLLQALKHDTYEGSAMASFLLSKSLESPRIAHTLYWLLVHSLPGDSPENSIDSTTNQSDIDESMIIQARYHRRNKMMLRALLAICGERLSSRFLSQKWMCKTLAEVAQAVKQSKDSLRQKTLIHRLENIHQSLLDKPTSLPLGPGEEVTGINLRTCSYFNSNTLPLKISFNGADGLTLPAIFKAGDDLQQDMLTIQLVRIMDKLWLAEGLDLKIVTFNCVPTGHKKGMIEMISDAETLRKIQVEYGLTGSFKDRPIAEWLQKQNPSQLEYQRAVDNFTVSCAGYSVATYILGICDRHNDNIMLKTSGHLFHIDFGKFLGDAQMFGNFKRDRTPFVLTSDMAYVINCGDKPSAKFHHFVDLCCRAFNIVRKHGDLILHMLALMATANIPGVTADAVQYVRKALLPSQSNPEAAASFAKMIQFSLKSWFTQFNFFLHNLAQLRFSSDDCGGELLSFVPKKYTMQLDGRLKSVMVHGYQKRYDIEKYYTYILRVTRVGQPDPAHLFRSYKEFLEFHQKLCLHFPLAKLHSLPSGIHVGRSNIKNVAERRLPEIRLFLISLFNSSDELAHSDLVYTFFHPLLRDQKETNINLSKVKETKPIPDRNSNVCGELKLSMQYRRGTLTVMIHHVRNLPILPGGQEPNTYVKCYLKPDPTKITKRKTKVVRKTCYPSFMETLEYRMPLELIQNRMLQVTVWSHDTLQENELLGGFDLPLSGIDLREELSDWFRLGYITR